MITISLCMIVRNESAVLKRCLDTAKNFVDEIIIVDTGSIDDTKEIAAGFTDKIYDFEWIDDFAAARNFSFDKAGMDYVMWLDADDVIEKKDETKLLELKQRVAPDTDVIMLPYHVAFDKERPTFTFYRERLLRRAAGFIWEGFVHEAIAFQGKIVYADAAVSHHKLKPSEPSRNLNIYRKKLAEGIILSPRDRFYFARELKDNKLYAESEAEFERFLNDGGGMTDDIIEACRDRAACLKELERTSEILPQLLQSFLYAAPRAETLCEVGACLFGRGDYSAAAFWYENALNDKRSSISGFVREDCRGLIPCLMLCVCYYKLGDRNKSEYYNDLAEKISPENPNVLYNKRFFASKRA